MNTPVRLGIVFVVALVIQLAVFVDVRQPGLQSAWLVWDSRCIHQVPRGGGGYLRSRDSC